MSWMSLPYELKLYIIELLTCEHCKQLITIVPITFPFQLLQLVYPELLAPVIFYQLG